MKKNVLYIAQSLDGYIADEKGGVDWLESGLEDGEKAMWEDYDRFIESLDMVVMGYTTYEQIVTELSPDVWNYEGLECWVVTSKERADNDHVQFWKGDPCQLVEENREKRIWIMGGAKLIKPLLAGGMIHELQIAVVPVILGRGIRLFQESDSSVSLKLTSMEKFGSMVMLRYDVLD